MEYELIRELPKKKPMGILFAALLTVISSAYLIYKTINDGGTFYDAIGLIVFIPVLLFIVFFNKPANNKTLFLIKINDNILSVNSNSAFWSTPISEVTGIEVEEPIVKWKVTTRTKALIIRKRNDSFYISLEGSKFKGHALNEVVTNLKHVCKLNA